MSDVLTCPYCLHENEDCWELTIGQVGTEWDSETECGRCGKTFAYHFETRCYWTSMKIEEPGK